MPAQPAAVRRLVADVLGSARVDAVGVVLTGGHGGATALRAAEPDGAKVGGALDGARRRAVTALAGPGHAERGRTAIAIVPAARRRDPSRPKRRSRGATRRAGGGSTRRTRDGQDDTRRAPGRRGPGAPGAEGREQLVTGAAAAEQDRESDRHRDARAGHGALYGGRGAPGSAHGRRSEGAVRRSRARPAGTAGARVPLELTGALHHSDCSGVGAMAPPRPIPRHDGLTTSWPASCIGHPERAEPPPRDFTSSP